ncbi:MAG: NAD(P)/FAD-dependent oxidoreductase [Dehalococcoidia bacterium]|nr:NAD(P)/FAD-dependent oxidoreductase [Dehalococcoidia bacterium]MDW8120536.1 NAD(P)/FAD-dependent oxidoreductase [Chloroflexota bacterium]
MALTYDVVVVGAGPAGSTVARLLAQRHFRVLLVEEHLQVGVPCHCSGLVTPRTLEAAHAPATLVRNAVRGVLTFGPEGTALPLVASHPKALVIDRVGLDAFLATQAQEAGADLLLGARALGIERNGNGSLHLRLRRNGHEETVACRLVVGADGSRSVVAQALGVAPREVVYALGGEVAIQGLDPSLVYVALDPYTYPGWFGWAIPLGDGMARIGVGTSQRGVSPRRLLQHLLDTFPPLRGARVVRLQGGVIPLASGHPHRLVGDGVLLVGDAGGQVKPSSGGGIYTGIVAAHWCAAVAQRALEKDDCSARALAPYQRWWHSPIGREVQRASVLRRLLLGLTPRELTVALQMLGHPRIARVIQEHGDIDFPGRAFARLLAPGPLWTAFRTLPLSLWPKGMRVAWAWAFSQGRAGIGLGPFVP